MLFNQSGSLLNCNKNTEKTKKIENSTQYEDKKFRNHVKWEEPPMKEYSSTMWEFLFKKNNRTPKIDLPRREVDLEQFIKQSKNKLNATWLGHSSLMISIDGYIILTDPVFEKKISILGPSRMNGEIPIDPKKLPKIDIVIISHDHYDHLNKYSVLFLKDKAKMFITPLGVGSRLEQWGIPGEKILEMDWWEEKNIDGNIMVAATPAQHFSGRGLTDRNKTLWASWVIKSPNYRIFFSGDSGYFKGFREIGKKYGPFDITFLECGAYNEKWHFVHMYPEETVQTHIELKGNILHPIHWATFNLSMHSWYEPMERLVKAADAAKIRIATPVVGDTTILHEYTPQNQWWEPSHDLSVKLCSQ